MVVAKNDAVHLDLAKQIEGKSAERRYVAVVAGDLAQDRFTVDAPIGRDTHHRVKMAVVPGGKHAVTHLKKLRRMDAGTLVAARWSLVGRIRSECIFTRLGTQCWVTACMRRRNGRAGRSSCMPLTLHLSIRSPASRCRFSPILRPISWEDDVVERTDLDPF